MLSRWIEVNWLTKTLLTPIHLHDEYTYIINSWRFKAGPQSLNQYLNQEWRAKYIPLNIIMIIIYFMLFKVLWGENYHTTD